MLVVKVAAGFCPSSSYYNAKKHSLVFMWKKLQLLSTDTQQMTEL